MILSTFIPCKYHEIKKYFVPKYTCKKNIALYTLVIDGSLTLWLQGCHSLGFFLDIVIVAKLPFFQSLKLSPCMLSLASSLKQVDNKIGKRIFFG